MLLIAIVSLIAAFSFASTAWGKGYDSPRFWSYPIALGAVINLINFLMGYVIQVFFGDGNSLFWAGLPYLAGFFFIVLFFALLAKGWKEIKALPQK
jgi:hypothetical protein